MSASVKPEKDAISLTVFVFLQNVNCRFPAGKYVGFFTVDFYRTPPPSPGEFSLHVQARCFEVESAVAALRFSRQVLHVWGKGGGEGFG